MAQAIFMSYQPQEHSAFIGEANIVPEMVWCHADIRPYGMQQII